MEPDEERALADRLARMDGNAWVQFSRDHYRPLMAFVRSYFRCDQDASEEVVQMAFVRCMRSIRTFDPSRGRLFGWLKAVAINEGRSLARRQRRSAELPLFEAGTALGNRGHSGEPASSHASPGFLAQVQDALTGLPAQYQRALVMKYVDGSSVAQTAEALGLSEKAAESLLTRAREAFRKAYRGTLERADVNARENSQ